MIPRLPRSTLFPYTTLFRSLLFFKYYQISRKLLASNLMTKNIYNKRSEEHTSELQSRPHLVCRLLLEKKNIFQVSSLSFHLLFELIFLAIYLQPFAVYGSSS